MGANESHSVDPQQCYNMGITIYDFCNLLRILKLGADPLEDYHSFKYFYADILYNLQLMQASYLHSSIFYTRAHVIGLIAIEIMGDYV